MTDKDFWKKQYEDIWEKTSEREVFTKEYIENITGFKLEPFGLGAESTEFIHGSAQDNGHEKGSPDYHAYGANIYIEITGPNIKVPENADLWFREDKLEYAYKHRNDSVVYIVNCFPNTWHILHITDWDEAIKQNNSGIDFNKIHPIIRGVKETYISVKQDNEFVMAKDDFLDILKEEKDRIDNDDDSPCI